MLREAKWSENGYKSISTRFWVRNTQRLVKIHNMQATPLDFTKGGVYIKWVIDINYCGYDYSFFIQLCWPHFEAPKKLTRPDRETAIHLSKYFSEYKLIQARHKTWGTKFWKFKNMTIPLSRFEWSTWGRFHELFCTLSQSFAPCAELLCL